MALLFILKSQKDIDILKETLAKRPSKKGFDAKRFSGIFSLEQEPLVIQHKLRSEWNDLR
ncbi:hypothetical protein GCM10023149_46900 [Mucilaginibacter gynuensis]|uniref:Uncharacterized protein n=1 Tax=Mucilaginibacter gynuensis TaxID=1302236 RepID=A0ABP8HCP9_9SPHI